MGTFLLKTEASPASSALRSAVPGPSFGSGYLSSFKSDDATIFIFFKNQNFFSGTYQVVHHHEALDGLEIPNLDGGHLPEGVLGEVPVGLLKQVDVHHVETGKPLFF